MIVAKFGGTSLADGPCFLARVPIVAERAEEGCVVVASAMAGVSRGLLQLVWKRQTDGLDPALEELESLLVRHRSVLSESGASTADALDCENAIAAEGARVEHLLRETPDGERIPERARDRILALGELLSSRLLAAVLRGAGLPATWIDPRELVVSDDRFGNARYDQPGTREAVAGRLQRDIGPGRVHVTGGFIARTAAGETTTLGWGASDTSATLLGACTGAREVEIWTDVDGIATADPRLVPGARTIPVLSFEEACDLTFFGAQVLHYSAIAPARAAGVPLRVRNSFRPERPGTIIRRPEDGAPAIRGLSLAGPMTRPEARALRGCGVHTTEREPPWALVKGRTFPFDARAGVGSPLSILAMVGREIDETPGIEMIDALLADREPEWIATDCPTHRAVLLPAHAGHEALRLLHARLF